MLERAKPIVSTFARLEFAYVIVALLLVSDALIPLLYEPAALRVEVDRTDSNATRMFAAIAIYCVALFLVLRRPSEPGKLLFARPDVLLLMFLPILSAFWSFDPPTIMRRALAHALTIVFCLYLVSRYTSDQFIRRLLIAFFIGGAASIFVCLFVPSIGVVQGQVNLGAWQGVYGHKATLGRIAVLAVLTSLLWRPVAAWEHLLRWGVLIMFVFLSIMSASRASWALLAAGLALIAILSVLRMPRLSVPLRVVIATCLAFVVVGAAVAHFTDALGAVGRDMTFSGRTRIWASAIATADESHAWFGAGYRAFWIGPDVDEVRALMPSWQRIPHHGHNGYLDVWLELGWVGVALFAIFVIATITMLLRCLARFPHRPEWLLFSAFFLLFLLNNASVSVAMRHTDMAWIFAVCSALYAAKALALQPVTAPRRRRMQGSPRPRGPFPAATRTHFER